MGRWSGIIGPVDVKDVGSSAQYLLEGEYWNKNSMEIFVGQSTAPGGYAWVFPKLESEANVGVMIQAQMGRAVELLDHFLDERFPDCTRVEIRGGCAPTTLPPDTFVNDNLMLVGDAVRLAFPFGAAGAYIQHCSPALWQEEPLQDSSPGPWCRWNMT